MKKSVAILILFLLPFASWLPAFVAGQNPPARPSTKGKPAKFKTLSAGARRALRRSSSSLLSLTSTDVASLPEVPPPATQSRVPQYVPDQLLVQLESREETRTRLGLGSIKSAKYRNEALRAAVQEDVHATQMSVAGTLSIDNAALGDLLVVNLPADKSPDEAILDLQTRPGVKSVQKNWIYTLQQNPTANDAEYMNGGLWGMFGDDLPTAIGPGALTTNEFGIQAEKAWFADHVGSRSVFVGIIDGGVQPDHPDLDQNIWINPGEYGPDETGQDKSTNGRDDDGDKLIDDIRGWDFNHQDGSTYDGEAPDEHGTHVAGTIGAVGNNSIGVAGVNWKVTIIPAKIFGSTGGTTDRAVEAIDYFIRLKSRGVNIVALNNSWGAFVYDPLLFEAIKRAARAGILFIAAAGNAAANIDDTPFYPACYDTTLDTRSGGGTPGVDYDSVISVAAIESNGDLASFSNFGRTTVDVGAPGGRIVSTVPSGEYGFLSGTSMAAPHVTGAAALYASSHSGARAQDIRSALLQTAAPTTSLQGMTSTGKRLNVSAF